MSKARRFSRITTLSKQLAVSILSLLAAAGCSGKSLPLHREPPVLPDTFSAQIDFTVNDLDGSAQLNQTDGTLELSFLKPETLSGFTASLSGGEVSLSFGGVAASLGESLPDGALITVLADAFALARSPEETEASPGGGDWTFAGTLPDAAGDFQLTVSSDGLPTLLIAEKAGITVLFTQAGPAF